MTIVDPHECNPELFRSPPNHFRLVFGAVLGNVKLEFAWHENRAAQQQLGTTAGGIPDQAFARRLTALETDPAGPIGRPPLLLTPV